MKFNKIKLILKINSFIRALCLYTHKLQFKYQWIDNINPPEWFDRFIDFILSDAKEINVILA